MKINKRKIIIMKPGINLKKESSKGDILVWEDKGKKDLIELVTNVNWMGITSILIDNKKTIYLLSQWWEEYSLDKGKFKRQKFYEKNILKNEIPSVIEGDPRYSTLKKDLEKAKEFYKKFI